MKPQVAILYGLGEGPAISKRLVKALQEHNFEITSDAAKADCVIAHSGGGFFMPTKHKAKVILLIGPSCGYEGSLIGSQVRKVRADIRNAIKTKQHWYWIYKSFWNAAYLFVQPRYTVKMWRIARRQKQQLPSFSAPCVMVITYREDPWSGNLPTPEVEKHANYSFVSYDAVHDDLWNNPENYVRILQYLYEHSSKTK